MEMFNILEIVKYITFFINEIETNSIKKEFVFNHLLRIFAEITLIKPNYDECNNLTLFIDKVSKCSLEMYNIVKKYENDSNYNFIKELEKIKYEIHHLIYL